MCIDMTMQKVKNMTSKYIVKDLGNGQKQLIVDFNVNDIGTPSSTGKSNIIASSNGFKKVEGSNVSLMFNVIKK